MGKISQSWELVKQSFAVLRSDKQLMLLPAASAVSCLLVSAAVLSGGGLLLYPQIHAALAANARWRPDQSAAAVGLLVFYFVNYSVIVFFNVALVSAASHRMEGKEISLRDVLRETWARKGIILQWAALAATVGVLLNMLEERVGWLGRIVVRLIGLAWALSTYLVVPILAFEDLGPVEALQRSAKLFRDTWGQEVTGGFSFGLIFFLLTLPGIALWTAATLLGGVLGLLGGGALMFLYFLLLGVVSAAVRGIFIAALYRYANTREVAPGFQPDQFTKAWLPK
jgi:uncharacterized protein DUF6159